MRTKVITNRDLQRCGRARAFTLLEALFAAAVLAIISLATIQGVSSGHQVSIAAQDRLLAVIVADNYLSELSVLPYAELPLHDGTTDEVGSLQTLEGESYPASVGRLGRTISVVADTRTIADPPIIVEGMTVSVDVFDESHTIISISRFFPEPAE
jgi:type II secretory pathway component PulJ